MLVDNTRHERQAIERSVWIMEAAAYMVDSGLYAVEEWEQAVELASNLHYHNRDEGGEMMASPKEAVDEEITYWGD